MEEKQKCECGSILISDWYPVKALYCTNAKCHLFMQSQRPIRGITTNAEQQLSFELEEVVVSSIRS